MIGYENTTSVGSSIMKLILCSQSEYQRNGALHGDPNRVGKMCSGRVMAGI